jgi:hypothetical protein
MAGVLASGHPRPTLTASGLPPRVAQFVDNGDGTATMTGTAVGTFPFIITATNGVGPPVVQHFTLTVDAPPTILLTPPPPFTVGQPEMRTITTTAGVPALTTLGISEFTEKTK